MNSFTVHPSPLSGTLSIPPSKSHSQRALYFAMKGQGTSQIENLLNSPDCHAMIRAIEQFGATCTWQDTTLVVQGGFYPAEGPIDAENSGQILRFLGALAALLPSYTEITGDVSIRKFRPIKPLLSALRQLGALSESICGDGFAPIRIKGPIHPGTCKLDGTDSQPVSALLMALSFLEGPSEIEVTNPGETPWIDLTLDWLRRLGAKVHHEEYRRYFVQGGLHYKGFAYTVPGDFSSAAYPLVAALITQSSLTLEGLDPTDIQGDRKILDLILQMGGKLYWDKKTLQIEPSSLCGIEIDINTCIDALPIFAVLGCFAKGTTRLYNGAIARKKESDRILAIATELRKMGGQIEEREDGLLIHQSPLQGATLCSHRDHRIALSLAVAALGAKTPSTIEGIEWIAKSYPTFVKDMQMIGAQFELDLVRV